MQVYTLLLAAPPGGVSSAVNFEAQDDREAVDLAAHYYSDWKGELRHGDRVVARNDRGPETSPRSRNGSA